MPLKIANTGTGPNQRKGTIGPIVGGWSEQEFATPVNPAETAGGTGMLSYSAGAAEQSLLIINNRVTATHTDEVQPLGSVEGVVRTVSQTGLNVSLTQDNKLAQFDTDRNMPPMLAASVPDALNLALEVTSTDARLTGPGGALWSLAGHAAGFDNTGQVAVADSYEGTYVYTVDGFQYFITETGTFNVANPESFIPLAGRTYANNLSGSSFIPWRGYFTPFTSLVNSVACKTLLDGSDFTFQVVGGPLNGPWVAPEYAYGQVLTVTIDESAETISILADYSDVYLDRVSGSSSASISGLDLTEELAVFIEMTYDGAGTYTSRARVCNVGAYGTSVTVSVSYEVYIKAFDRWFFPWEMAGNVRSVWQWSDNDAFMSVEEYENELEYNVVGTYALGHPSIGFTGNVWQWLQNACTAYGWEICLIDDVITTRPIGSATLYLTNGSGVTITPSTTFTGRSIDVKYTDAVIVDAIDALNADIYQGGLVYDARADDNRILTVGAAQVTETKLETDAYLTSIIQPTRVTTFIPDAGTYYVIDSTGLPIVADQWEDYGGSVQVAIDPDQAGVLNVTVVGPREEIPSTTGPYSLAVSDGSNEYAALSILGSGVVANRKTLELLTGADPDKTPQQIAITITNPFICTLEQAYDSGMWASVDASGPRVSFTVTVPIQALEGFGQTAGSLVNYGHSTYRVVSATVGSLGATLECVRHVTAGQFDGVWDGLTVADHDATWTGYVCEDQMVLPYLNPNLGDGFGFGFFGLEDFGS